MLVEEFNGRNSAARLRALQDCCISKGCCTSGVTVPENGYEHILIVAGADGKYNRGSQAVLKYLFLGASGQNLLGDQVISQEFDALEDTMLLISYSSVHIYYHANAKDVVLPIISCWNNVTEYPMHTKDVQNTEIYEKFKIDSFVSMVEGVKSVGVPLDSSDPMQVEKWPMVQAYGLDEVSRRGFFTMNVTVKGCAKDLSYVMSSLVDDMCIKKLIYEAKPLLQQHWEDFITRVDHVEDRRDRLLKTELDLGDDLLSFYDFGTVRHSSRGLLIRKERGARVLLGTHTSDVTAKSREVNAFDSGIGSFPATHFIAEAEDPTTGFRVARTHFLASGKLAERVVVEDVLVHSINNALEKYKDAKDNSLDTRFLMELYAQAMKALQAAISAFVQSAKSSHDQMICEKDAMEAIVKIWKAAQNVDKSHLTSSLFSLTSNFELKVENFNALGEPEPFKASQGWKQVYMKLIVKNIPSKCIPGEILGSVMVGDTFVFNEETSLNLSAAVFPYFRSWVMSGKEEAFLENMNASLLSEFMLEGPLQLGEEIGETIAHSFLMFDSWEYPLVEGSIRAYTDGFVFKTSAFNSVIVSFKKDVRCIHLATTSHDGLLLFIIDFNESSTTPTRKSFPLPVISSTLAIPLISGSRVQEAIFAIFHHWKQSAFQNDLPFYKPGDDFDDKKDSLNMPTTWKQACDRLVEKENDDDVKKALTQKFYIPSFQTMTSAWTRKCIASSTSYSIPISIVLGIPGSLADVIGASICDLSESSNSWEMIHIDTRLSDESPETYLTKHLSVELTKTIHKMLAVEKYDRRPRILLAITGFLGPITVVHAIKKYKDPQLIKIASLISVVKASNLHIPRDHHQIPFPKLYDQIAAGWADAIVLTDYTDAPQEQVAQLRYRVSKSNPFADLFCLSSNVFEGPLGATLLAVDSFESTHKQAYREVVYPQWSTKPEKYTTSAIQTTNQKNIMYQRFRIPASFDRQLFAMFVGALAPRAPLNVTDASLHPLEVPVKLKGLRLAQSLAKQKVCQEMDPDESDRSTALRLASPEQCGWVWGITGVVALNGASDTVVDYDYATTGVRSTLHRRHETPYNKTERHLIFTGEDLKEEGLRQLILASFPVHAKFHALKTRASITLKEKKEIQHSNAIRPLPPGYFFDGRSYVDVMGASTEFHPQIDQFIDEYLLEQNESFRTSNIDAEKLRNEYEGQVKTF